MKIAYDASVIAGNRTGVEFYALRLYEALAELPGVEVVALSDHAVPEIPDAVVRESSLPRALWRQLALPRLVTERRCTSLHVPVTSLPIRHTVPVVVTVHDLAWKIMPECYRARQLAVQRLWFRAACRRADRIVCVSESTRRDVIRFAPEAAAKAVAVLSGAVAANPAPCDEAAVHRVLERFGITTPYLLAVGRIERRKNPAHVVRAFAQATSTSLTPCATDSGQAYTPELGAARLVFAGAPGNAMAETQAAAHELGVADRVVFCDYVGDSLGSLYQAATALVYASRYEGFGHPPFEAISLGTPVIASDIPSTRETLGAGGLLVPADDPAALAAAMQRVLREPAFREELLARGRERLRAFSWHSTAEHVAALHRELAR